MNPVILVGRRAGNEHRDMLWQFCLRRWQEQLDYLVVEGHHGGPLGDDGDHEAFCLSVAFNRAAARASTLISPDWDVAVLVGADWIADTGEQVRDAAAQALEIDQLVFAHDRTCVLTEDGTEMQLDAEFTSPILAGTGDWHKNTFSGILAVPRTLWDEVGGFDERFIGWGYDDLAFWSACCALRGKFQRVDGGIGHLWHPRTRAENEEQPHHSANQVLGERYLAEKWSRGNMLAILAERNA